MSFLLVFLAIISLSVAFIAWRKSSRIQSEIGRIKALLNIIENRIMELPDHQQETLHHIRMQLLRLASGMPVTKEMVFSDQSFMEITPADAQGLYEQERENIFWLDVRHPEEYLVKKIPGAYLLPLDELKERFQKEVPSHTEKILVYCESGIRSREACDFLSRQGFANVYHLKEGLSNWQGPLEIDSEPRLIHIQSHL